MRSILHASRRNNARVDVTGCLLFSGRCFAQVLEGDEVVVKQLPRESQPTRAMPSCASCSRRGARSANTRDWSMGYLHDLNLEDDLETLLMIPSRSPVVVADVMERMRPDPVMGALR